MLRKILGWLLLCGAVGIVALAIAVYLDPSTSIWQSVGPLFLAAMFLFQGHAYLSTPKPTLANGGLEVIPRDEGAEEILNKLKAATPRCLAGFRVQDSDLKFVGAWHSGPHFVTKRISCECGSQDIELLASPTDDGEFLAPLHLRCPECSSHRLMFDPTIHGWDGESGASASRVGVDKPQVVGSSPGTVIVVYSYQGIENYSDLIDGGELNPEDFFDTFTVYFAEQVGHPSLVVSYECA